MSAETLNILEDHAPNSSIRPNSSETHASVEIREVCADSNTRAPAPADAAIGKVLDGKYRVERKIGEGAMGVVLAATHLALDELVAIRPEVQSLEGTRERFAKEAKIAARIRSEHVAKVLDVGDFEPLGPYIVMEYLEGKSLSELLDARLLDRLGPMPAERVVEYVLQACEALAAAHAIGVIHRDVKPDNLFLTRHGGIETLKLLDFGISKAALTAQAAEAETATSTTTLVMGTPLYMSPEQLRSLPDVDGRTDIWSMGASMYELLSGRPPFHAASVPEICAAILELQPAPLPLGCPDPLRAVVMRCLEKDRERRFQTVAELASALVPLAPGDARAYASRSSCILRASALHLEVVVEDTRAASPVAASAPRALRLGNAALIAVLAVLASSALGIAIVLWNRREAVTVPSAMPLTAPIATTVVAAAEAASLVVQQPSSDAPVVAPATESDPAIGLAPLLPAEAPARESSVELVLPPDSKAARTAHRAPSRGSPATRSTIGTATRRPEAAISVAERGGRVRLVETRARLRLVERVEAPARPTLVKSEAVAVRSAVTEGKGARP